MHLRWLRTLPLICALSYSNFVYGSAPQHKQCTKVRFADVNRHNSKISDLELEIYAWLRIANPLSAVIREGNLMALNEFPELERDQIKDLFWDSTSPQEAHRILFSVYKRRTESHSTSTRTKNPPVVLETLTGAIQSFYGAQKDWAAYDPNNIDKKLLKHNLQSGLDHLRLVQAEYHKLRPLHKRIKWGWLMRFSTRAIPDYIRFPDSPREKATRRLWKVIVPMQKALDAWKLEK